MKKLISMLFLTLPSMVSAHAVIQQTDAESGSYYKGVIGLSHGCDGSATTKVTITIPNGFRGAKPMPKPGWKLDVVKSVLENRYQSHGKTVTEDVTQITWYGGVLEHAHYDEFVFRGQIGVGTTTRLYFPVRQECVVGELNWDQIPGEKPKGHEHHGDHGAQDSHSGHADAKLEYPAPVVRVVDGTGMHHH
ncbi:YcnI family protein [Methylophaga sp.]|uniref:YcnI family copper-binding membrane protein n=1 Tax=Methylophaga sp. TaxID=2024840 RepID=UPI0014012FA1|nr:YcnI family protein [Methylophaga sp.]MTI64370.1 YcnI family protein [Methylophaga sp.]